MIRKEKGVFTHVAELAGFFFVKPLTVVQSIDLQYLLHIPTTAFNCMRTVFLDLDYVRVFLLSWRTGSCAVQLFLIFMKLK